MVDLENGIVERESFYAVFQLLIENHPALVEVLIVDADGEDEMEEDVVWDAIAPRHFDAGAERTADVVEVELPVIVRDVANRHVGIQEREGFPFVVRQRLVEDGKQLPGG